MELTPEELAFFNRLLARVAERTCLAQMDAFVQHGDTSTLWHSIAVAYYSLWLARRLGIGRRVRSLVCGALLHDYFLYDWHDKDPSHRLHGFTHPRRALENAAADWELTDRERDIILHHMFPLTPLPPRSREAWLVCLADKLCATAEVLGYWRRSRVREKAMG